MFTGSGDNCDHSPWFAHPIYQRYWTHYSLLQGWFHHSLRNPEISNCENRQCSTKCCCSYKGNEYNNYAASHYKSEKSPYRGRKNKRNTPAYFKRHHRVSKREANSSYGTQSKHSHLVPKTEALEYIDETSDEDFNFEMTMTSEFMELMAISEKHKQERDALRKAAAEEEANIEYVELGCLSETRKLTCLPPKQKDEIASKLREMEILYGEKAVAIYGMETAMQLTFDRWCDSKQPKMWPNIPLRF